VAISDALGLTAQGIETIQRKEENKLRRTLARIEELISEYDVDKIVLGFPKHMNNDIGERAQKSLEFGDMLIRRTGLEVIMWDERLTTVEAERVLIEGNVRRENRKKYIDKIAAVFILQAYLDSEYLKQESRKEPEE
jgi:putative Holliday junction resolvase